MALGGGTWTAQDKVLPGTFINVSSAAKATATLSDRGFVAMPLMLDWGPDSQVFTVTNSDFQKNSLALFGYASDDAKMLPLRELFQNAQTLYAYRLNSGGTKAANDFCTAKYAGIAGNKLYTVVSVNVDDNNFFDVNTYYGTRLVDTQTVANAGELVANDFVVFKATAALEETAKAELTGGANGSVDAAAYQAFLEKIESYSYNALGCPSADATTIGMFVNFTKRMRDEVGAKFQTVIFNQYGNSKHADYEGVIEVGNVITDYDATLEGFGAFGAIYWVTGIAGACAVNKSNTNKLYNGELSINVGFTQAELKTALREGRFMFHNVNGEVRVLDDINSLITLSDAKGEDFKANQTIRVCDQLANDIAVLFNTRYLGVIPNDEDARISLWNDICKIYQTLESIRAIESFDPATVSVTQGATKKSVVCTTEGLRPINAMAQLYMSVIIQ